MREIEIPTVGAPTWGYFGHTGVVPCEVWMGEVIELVGTVGLGSMDDAKLAWDKDNHKAIRGAESEYCSYILSRTAVKWEEEDAELPEDELDYGGRFTATKQEHFIFNHCREKYKIKHHEDN